MSANYKAKFRIFDFGGGINRRDSEYKKDLRDVDDAINCTFEQDGTAASRRGYSIWIDQGYLSIADAVTQMHRHYGPSGKKRVLAYSLGPFYGGGSATNGKLFSSDDSGKFTFIGEGYTPRDDYPSFTSWRDVAFFCGRGMRLHTSNIDNSAPTSIPEAMLPGVEDVTQLTTVVGGDGASLPQGYYTYRISFDMFDGDTYLGESFPANHRWTEEAGDGEEPSVDYRFQQIEKEIVTAGEKIYFYRKHTVVGLWPWGSELVLEPMAALPANAKYINFYRAYGSTTGKYSRSRASRDFKLVKKLHKDRWNEIRDITYLAGDGWGHYNLSNLLLFEDSGITPRRIIPPPVMKLPPEARFSFEFASRLFLSNVTLEATNGVRTDHPHRLYYSELMKPANFRHTSWYEIGKDGEGLTGHAQFDEQSVLAFKASKTYVLTISGREILDGVLDIHQRMIDGTRGCVAPKTIANIPGGVAFLSHEGPCVFDGKEVRLLNADHVKPWFEAIPANLLSGACGAYSQKYRAYFVAISSGDGAGNKMIFKFDMKTGGWSRDLIGPIDCFLSISGESEEPKLLMGTGLRGLSAFASGEIYEYGGSRQDGATPASIPFTLLTQKYSFCSGPEMVGEIYEVLVFYDGSEPVSVDFIMDGSEGPYDTSDYSETLTTVGSTAASQYGDGSLYDDGSTYSGPFSGARRLRLPAPLRGKRVQLRFTRDCVKANLKIHGFVLYFNETDQVDPNE